MKSKVVPFTERSEQLYQVRASAQGPSQKSCLHRSSISDSFGYGVKNLPISSLHPLT